MNAEDQSKTSTGQVSKRIHRRTKQEIPNLYICGDGHCRKSYGTNAALYTHIKKKHDGIEPEGTERPKPNLLPKTKKSRQSSEQHHKEEVAMCMRCQKKQCKCKAFFQEQNVGVLAEQDFIMFVRYISLFGEDGVREGGLWVRVVDDAMEQFNEERLGQILSEWSKEYQMDLQLTRRQIQYLTFSSCFWDRSNILQLYQGLFSALKLMNKRELIRLSNRTGKLKTFVSCVQSHEKDFNIVVSLLSKK